MLMNGYFRCIVAVVIASCSFLAASQPKQSRIELADQLFQLGKFAEAGELYSLIVAQKPNDPPSLNLRGLPTGKGALYHSMM
jgi:hypothetical protein